MSQKRAAIAAGAKSRLAVAVIVALGAWAVLYAEPPNPSLRTRSSSRVAVCARAGWTCRIPSRS
jgi:hypothetical protein